MIECPILVLSGNHERTQKDNKYLSLKYKSGKSVKLWCRKPRILGNYIHKTPIEEQLAPTHKASLSHHATLAVMAVRRNLLDKSVLLMPQASYYEPGLDTKLVDCAETNSLETHIMT